MREPTGLDRRAATAAIGAALCLGASGRAAGQTAGLEIVAVGSPGDGNDQLARALAEGLAHTYLVPRAIAANATNVAGAVGDFVDGKRPRAGLLVMSLTTLGVMIGARTEGALDFCRPVALLAAERQPIVTAADSRFRTIEDLMRALRDDPGGVSWTGRSRYGADHQLCLSLIRAAGGDPSRADYETTDADGGREPLPSMALLTGKTQIASGALSEFAAQIRGGTLRALALASPDRAPDVDLPTLRELGVDLAMFNWRGVVARAATGDAMISRLEQAIPKLVALTGWRQMVRQRYWSSAYGAADEFARHLAGERARVAALLKETGAL